MTSTKKLQVPWLLAPVWKDLPVRKGLGHHRKPVGIILGAFQELHCKIESDSLNQVQVRLLNDDIKTEGQFFVEAGRESNSKIYVDSVSVPFIDCEYLKKTPEDKRTISLTYPSVSKILPIYRFGDDEDKFFKLWDMQDAEFAYVESDYFGLLIPKIDKEAARKLPEDKHLNDLIVFYDDILTFYSKLIGFSFEESGINQNVKNIFFIKADKSGLGGAYYLNSWTAVSSASIKDFWLDIDPTNWGALHEIGHGHELRSLDDETFNVREVWNNIFCFFYQSVKIGKDLVSKGYIKRTSLMIIDTDLKSGKGVKNWDYFEKLSFLVHMFYKAGQESFTHFNVLTRRELAGSPYYNTGLFFVEKLMHFFAIEFEIDVYPFMKLARAEIREEQLLEHYYVWSNVAYPLNYLISDVKEMNATKDKLGLIFTTSLVTPLDLISTKLKNDFTLIVDSKLYYNVLSGDVVKLMDGSRIIAEEKILSQTITFKDIPIGVYKVFVEPNQKNTKFAYDNFYAVVHANQKNELLLSAKLIQTPLLCPDEIKFLGFSDLHFASLTAYPLRNMLNFRFFAEKPHYYYAGVKYAGITIRNKQNEIIFVKNIDGSSDSSEYVSQDIKIDGQVEIEIYHAETSNRLIFKEQLMNEVIDRSRAHNYFILNELGFQNKYKTTPKEMLENNFLKKIDYIAENIRRKISLFVRPYSQSKYIVLLAVKIYERLFNNNSVSQKVRDLYKDRLPLEDALLY